MPNNDVSGDNVTKNRKSRKRLLNIVSSLNDQRLTRIANHGWTVSMTLAHMAFYDNYRLEQLRRWEQTGFNESKADTEAINSGLRPLLEGVDGGTATRCVVSAVEAIDQQIEDLNPRLTSEIERNGRASILDRSRHRNEHLDEIEQALSSESRGT